jgi:HD-GYP domain-containing protein (c-di-GMP phosphodiesterase class II)
VKFRENIIAQYTIGTLLVTVVFALVLSFFLTSWARDFQIAHHIDLYPEFISQMVKGSPETKSFLQNPKANGDEEPAEVEEFFHKLKELGGIFRVKVWSTGGLIIWCDSYDVIGKSFPENIHFKKAWQGEIAYSIAKPHKEEHQTEKGRETVLEIYTPVIIAGKVIAVIELYEGADELFKAIRKNAVHIYVLIGFAVTILYCLLFFVFYQAQNRQKEILSELIRTQDGAIVSLASLAETRDNETGAHILRTQRYIKVLAEHLRGKPLFSEVLTPGNIELLFKSAPLHDVGKVGVRDSILLKPGKLTDEEFEEMKKHTILGQSALEEASNELGANSFLHFAQEIALNHHEKWDGSGYPRGLKGYEIPVSGMLMALADVYDALISERVYKEAFSHEKALEIISEGRGTHFCPEVVDAFLEYQEEFRSIAKEFEDS